MPIEVSKAGDVDCLIPTNTSMLQAFNESGLQCDTYHTGWDKKKKHTRMLTHSHTMTPSDAPGRQAF